MTTIPATRRGGRKVSCLECDARLELDDRLLVGEVVHCENCLAQLEVAEVDPVVLAPLAPIEETVEDFESWG